MPIVSKAKRISNAKYDKNNFSYHSIKYKNTDKLIDMVRYAVKNGKGKSINDYMIQAIKNQLEKDCITIDMLPALNIEANTDQKNRYLKISV